MKGVALPEILLLLWLLAALFFLAAAAFQTLISHLKVEKKSLFIQNLRGGERASAI